MLRLQTTSAYGLCQTHTETAIGQLEKPRVIDVFLLPELKIETFLQ